MPSIVFDSDREPDPIENFPLQFERGDLKVALELHPRTDFLLRSDLLVELSGYFNGSKANWTHNAKVIQRPATAAELKEKPTEMTKDKKIHTYYLVTTQKSVLMLDSTPLARRDFNDEEWHHHNVHHFYVSELANGFMPREGDPLSVKVGAGGGLSRARLEHALLFGLLFQRDQQISLIELDYTGLANLVALAEVYDVICYVAPGTREHLLRREDLWQDV